MTDESVMVDINFDWQSYVEDTQIGPTKKKTGSTRESRSEDINSQSQSDDFHGSEEGVLELFGSLLEGDEQKDPSANRNRYFR